MNQTRFPRGGAYLLEIINAPKAMEGAYLPVISTVSHTDHVIRYINGPTQASVPFFCMCRCVNAMSFSRVSSAILKFCLLKFLTFMCWDRFYHCSILFLQCRQVGPWGEG